MSPRPPSGIDPLELAVRARRGELSSVDRREFERGLASSAAVRIAYRVGRDFDAVLRVRPGDEALLERVTRVAAVRDSTKRRSGRLLGAALGLAAALLVGTAGATAAGIWRPSLGLLVNLWKPHGAASVPRVDLARRPSRRSQSRASTTPPSAPPDELAAGPASSTLALPMSVDVAPVEPPLGARQPSHRGANAGASTHETGATVGDALSAAVPSAAAPSVSVRSAASWFRAASSARREGDFARAEQLYEALVATFPESEEARVSRVSLGKLLLASGDAGAAERQFASYLASGGDLTAEALVGRAESLGRLGEHGEERRVWAELLARFGQGVYAERARARLDELDHTDAPAP